MRRKISWGVALGTLGPMVLAASPLAAQETAPVNCAAPVVPTGALAPWASPLPATAASNEGSSKHTPLALGQTARLTLRPTSKVRFPVRPGKSGGSVSYGGMLRLDVRESGTYRVALGSAAWIDIVRNRRAVTSVAHSHGPDCTGIRKMVDFPLAPGRYTLQIAADDEPQTIVLFIRLP